MQSRANTLPSTAQRSGHFLVEAVSLTVDLPEVIEVWKLQRPSLYASEIREKLHVLRECKFIIVHRQMFQQIVTNKKLGMTYKKLTSILSEYMTPENLAKVDDYLNITSGLNNFR